MPRNDKGSDPIARHRVAVRNARNDGERLDLHIGFLNDADGLPPRARLELTDEALQIRWQEKHRLRFAKLYRHRAHLLRHPDIGTPDEARENLRLAVRECGDAADSDAARLLLDIGADYESIADDTGALPAYRTVAEACIDAVMPILSKTERRNGEERRKRTRLHREAIEAMLALARRHEDAGLPDVAVGDYGTACRVCPVGEKATGRKNNRHHVEEDDPEPFRLRAAALHGLGRCQLRVGRFNDALAAYLEAYELNTRLNHYTMSHSELEAASLAAIAHTYARLASPQAEDYYRRSLEAARVSSRTGELALPVAEAYEHLAAAQLALRKHASARGLARRSALLYRRIGDNAGVIRTGILYGDILASEGRGEDAVREYSAAYDALTAGNDERRLASLYIRIGCVYRDAGQYDLALHWFDRALRASGPINDLRARWDAHRELSGIYRLKNRWAKAFEHTSAAHALEMQLIEREQRRAIMMMQGEFDPAQARRNEMRLRTTQHELMMKNNRLLTLGIRLVQQSGLIANLRDALQDLRSRMIAEGDISEVEDLIRRIEVAQRADADWENLLEQIHEVHPGAVDRMRQEYPSLTQTEAKVCALRLLGLSHKEIGGILGKPEKTISKHIQHSRNKMKLPSDVDLVRHLQSLTDRGENGSYESRPQRRPRPT